LKVALLARLVLSAWPYLVVDSGNMALKDISERSK
jgi:hypothetical protein